jgi:hypothetical protein
MAAGRPGATQQILELAFYHVGGRQPHTGVGDQYFLRTFGGRRSSGLGREYLLPIPVKRIQKTPAFSVEKEVRVGANTRVPGTEKAGVVEQPNAARPRRLTQRRASRLGRAAPLLVLRQLPINYFSEPI